MTQSASVTVIQMKGYRVSNNGEYGTFVVEHGVDESSGNGWLNLMMDSSYASGGYQWSNIGTQNWVQFLSKVQKNYLMDKLLGSSMMVFDSQNTLNQIELYFKSDAAAGSFSSHQIEQWIEAIENTRKEGLANDLNDLSEMLENNLSYEALEAFEDSSVIDHIRDFSEKKMSSSAVGIWEDLWPAFIEHIKNEAQSEENPVEPDSYNRPPDERINTEVA